ncbi:hypothetical protein IMSAGC003_03880 [Lachnospiraceae bacterium]|nr:hypothetical protein IMSAGC003_03880 [Lachnospiraceae bacterium]
MQGGQLDGKHIETIEQVVAEPAFFYKLPKILVAGGNDPYIDRNNTVTADTHDFVLFENTEKSQLAFHIHF